MTPNGEKAFNLIKTYFSDGTHFSLKDLKEKSGEEIGNVLSPLYKEGYLARYNTKPVTYSYLTDNSDEALQNIEGIFNIEDVEKWPLWSQYPLNEHFIHIGKIIPNIETESLDWKPDNTEVNQYAGLDYAFVCNNHLYKIGKTDVTMKERIQSYNCGKTAFRKNGTCSVTNYKVLKTFLNINHPIDVYAFLAPKATLTVFGNTYEINESPAKFIEGMLIQEAKKAFNNLPGCFQD